MNKQEYLLTCLMEECAEVQKCAAKIQRFAATEEYEGRSNADRLADEVVDLLAVLELVIEAGVVPQKYATTHINQKKDKVRRYMQESIRLGTLDAPEPMPENVFQLYPENEID